MDEKLDDKDSQALAYASAGRAGTPLLLVHGYPLDRSMWTPQLDALGDVARVIAPDLRGFGESPAAEYQATYTSLPRATTAGPFTGQPGITQPSACTASGAVHVPLR